ncbi:MAG: hypothetical protein U1E60_01755 [Reyranellaceae bacterium]
MIVGGNGNVTLDFSNGSLVTQTGFHGAFSGPGTQDSFTGGTATAR